MVTKRRDPAKPVGGHGYVPDRGDVVWLRFAPTAGHEQSGHRPALVISPAAYNGKVGLAILCPITSAAKGYPFEVSLPSDFAVKGVVLADQVKSLDWRARAARFEATTEPSVVAEVVLKLETLLR